MNTTSNETMRNMQASCAANMQHCVGIGIIFLFSSLAIIANFIVLVIIRRKKQQRTSFDLVIASLSMTDFCASISSFIMNVYQVAILFLISNETGKPYLQSAIAMMVVAILFCLSLMHVLLITFLRFSALFWPLKFRQVMTTALIKGLIAVTWTFSLIGGFILITTRMKNNPTGIIFLACGGLVCCAYAIIAIKICILSKTSQNATNKERRVFLNSFGVAITFFGCMFPLAGLFSRIKVVHDIDPFLALSIITINFLADPLLYFYFSYWLGKRDERRRIRNNFAPVQDQDLVQNDETRV